ncbi:MAG: hypothetical protein H6732_10505, partial [Alphaproteobacteria bacterium]|nr:hypothetical protein [Alphaproteobacteria bacterium]
VKATVTKATGDSATVDVTVTRGGREVAHTTFERPWGLAHVLSVGRDGDATLLVPVRVSR